MNLKKINIHFKLFFLFFCLFFVYFCFCEVISIGQYTFDISQKNISIPVQISSNIEFCGFQVNLSFDSKILNVISVKTGDFVSSFNILNNKGPGFVRIAGFSPNLSGLTGSGVIAYVDFELISPGSTNLILSGRVSDKNGKAIPFSFLSGKIEVKGQTLTQQGQQNPQQNKEEKKDILSIAPNFISSTFSYSQYPQSTVDTQIFQSTPSTFYYQPPVTQTSSQTTSSIQRTSTTVSSQVPSTPLIEDPNAKNNCVLFIISEYGSPQPANGFHTFKKGDKIECKVEKEVVIGNKKFVCDGYDGYGSIDDGKENYVSFTITTDTKIKWKWKLENP